MTEPVRLANRLAEMLPDTDKVEKLVIDHFTIMLLCELDDFFTSHGTLLHKVSSGG